MAFWRRKKGKQEATPADVEHYRAGTYALHRNAKREGIAA